MSIDQTWTLEEVLLQTIRIHLDAKPLLSKTSPWLALKKGLHEKLRVIVGRSYRAYEGCGLTPREIFVVEILEVLNDKRSALIRNVKKQRAKFKVSKDIVERVEADVIYPIVLGRNIHKWNVDLSNMSYSIVLYDPSTGEIVNEAVAKVQYPGAYSYFSNFRNELVNAANYKQYGKCAPFYFIFRLKKEIFAPFKVLWREVGTKIDAAVVGNVNDKYLGKKIPLPDYTCVYIPLSSKEEAHYVCAILNSTISKLVTSYIHLHPDPHVLDYIKIPPYDPGNSLHKQVVTLSETAHMLAEQGLYNELRGVEEKIDNTVAQIYGLTDEELKEIKKCLVILEGGEAGEEENEEIVELPPSAPDISLRNNVVGEGKPFSIDVVVLNPFEEPLGNVLVELKLFDNRTVKKNFEEVKGEISFPLSFGGLKAGEYKVKATFEYVIRNIPKRVEKELTIYVKGSEIKHVERSFKPEDLLGV